MRAPLRALVLWALGLLELGFRFGRAQHEQQLAFLDALALLHVHLLDTARQLRRDFDVRCLDLALNERRHGADGEPTDQRDGDDRNDDADSQSDDIAFFHMIEYYVFR